MDDFGNLNPEELEKLRAQLDLKKFLQSSIHEVLDSRDSMSKVEHRTHHKFIEDLLQKKELRARRWEIFHKSSLGAIATVFVLGAIKFLHWMGELIILALHLKPPSGP